MESEPVRRTKAWIERLLESKCYPYSRTALGKALLRLADLQGDGMADEFIAEMGIRRHYPTITNVAHLRWIRAAHGRGWHGPNNTHPGPKAECELCRKEVGHDHGAFCGGGLYRRD